MRISYIIVFGTLMFWIAACSKQGMPPVPLEGEFQLVRVPFEGRKNVKVLFSFKNKTSSDLPAPQVKTSCGCAGGEFLPAILAPGEIGRLELTTNVAQGRAKNYTADLRWGTVTSRVTWAVVTKRPVGLLIDPSRVSRQLLGQRKELKLAFCAAYDRIEAPDLGIFKIILRSAQYEQEAQLIDCKRIDNFSITGYLILKDSKSFQVAVNGHHEDLITVVATQLPERYLTLTP